MPSVTLPSVAAKVLGRLLPSFTVAAHTWIDVGVGPAAVEAAVKAAVKAAVEAAVKATPTCGGGGRGAADEDATSTARAPAPAALAAVQARKGREGGRGWVLEYL